MKHATSVLAAILLATVFLTQPAHAVVKAFLIHLDGDQARPAPIVTPGSGEGNIEVDTDANTIKVKVSSKNLTSAETVAHIHGPTAVGEDPREQTAGPLFGLPAGAVKVLTIDYSGHAMPDSVDAWLLSGRTYVNIHTLNNGGGEIRGQIDDNQPIPGGSVPALDTWGAALLAMGLMAAALVWMRRRQALLS